MSDLSNISTDMASPDQLAPWLRFLWSRGCSGSHPCRRSMIDTSWMLPTCRVEPSTVESTIICATGVSVGVEVLTSVRRDHSVIAAEVAVRTTTNAHARIPARSPVARLIAMARAVVVTAVKSVSSVDLDPNVLLTLHLLMVAAVAGFGPRLQRCGVPATMFAMRTDLDKYGITITVDQLNRQLVREPAGVPRRVYGVPRSCSVRYGLRGFPTLGGTVRG